MDQNETTSTRPACGLCFRQVKHFITSGDNTFVLSITPRHRSLFFPSRVCRHTKMNSIACCCCFSMGQTRAFYKSADNTIVLFGTAALISFFVCMYEIPEQMLPTQIVCCRIVIQVKHFVTSYDAARLWKTFAIPGQWNDLQSSYFILVTCSRDIPEDWPSMVVRTKSDILSPSHS